MMDLVLDTILSGDGELSMPSGSMLDFEEYQRLYGIGIVVRDFLAVLAEVSRQKFDTDFASLAASERLVAINACKLANVRLFSIFLTHVMRSYYSSSQVLARLSAGAVPPFPDGNVLDADDWTILGPVYERGSIYRDLGRPDPIP